MSESDKLLWGSKNKGENNNEERDRNTLHERRTQWFAKCIGCKTAGNQGKKASCDYYGGRVECCRKRECDIQYNSIYGSKIFQSIQHG